MKIYISPLLIVTGLISSQTTQATDWRQVADGLMQRLAAAREVKEREPSASLTRSGDLSDQSVSAASSASTSYRSSLHADPRTRASKPTPSEPSAPQARVQKKPLRAKENPASTTDETTGETSNPSKQPARSEGSTLDRLLSKYSVASPEREVKAPARSVVPSASASDAESYDWTETFNTSIGTVIRTPNKVTVNNSGAVMEAKGLYVTAGTVSPGPLSLSVGLTRDEFVAALKTAGIF